ncbi:MAG: hypothetical protein RLZZ360_617 [Candidatus Parcubacteria bacterium]|jgi:large subunit ribosomal protein L9
MKVILLRDVARLGKRFSVVEVPDGFALNKLIPQGQAQPATPENLKRVQARNKEVAAHQAADEAGLKTALKALAESPLSIKVEANAQGHLFQAVKTADIALAAAAAGHPIEVAVLHIETPIKSLGEHAVGVNGGGVSGTITINVVTK